MRFFHAVGCSKTSTRIFSTRVVALVLGASTAAFVSARANATVTFSNIADTTMNAPGETAFTGFGAPSLSGNNVAFEGSYTFITRSLPAIYSGTVGVTGASVVDDPDQIFNLYGFGNPAISGTNIAFYEQNSGVDYIYRRPQAQLGSPQWWRNTIPRRVEVGGTSD